MKTTPTSPSKLEEIRDELYGGSWDVMLSDLRIRAERRPYNHRIINQIKADIEMIEKTLRNHKEPLDP